MSKKMNRHTQQEKENAAFLKSEARYTTLGMLSEAVVACVVGGSLMLFVATFFNIYLQLLILGLYIYISVKEIHENYAAVLTGTLSSDSMHNKIKSIVRGVVTIILFITIIFARRLFEAMLSGEYSHY